MPKPGPYTSPLARFGVELTHPGPGAAPDTIAFAEARCEIQSEEIPRPASMRLVGDTLAFIGGGGWKEQSGFMTIHDLSCHDGPGRLSYPEKSIFFLV